MPLYTYHCTECTTEVVVPLRVVDLNTTPITCPVCGAPMERRFSSTAFAIRGYSAANGYSKGKP